MFDAILMTRRVSAILAGNRSGRVLAAFSKVCNLIGDGGELLSIATRQVGPGPLNLVIDRPTLPDWQPGAPYRLDGSHLHIGRETIDLSGVELWEPRPDWCRLRQQHQQIRSALPAVRRAVNQSLSAWRAQLPESASERGPVEHDPVPALAEAQALVSSLCGVPQSYGAPAARPPKEVEALSRHGRGLADAVEALCGLGPGLTPAGDDWLAGWLLGLHLFAPALVAEAAAATLAAAATRTTILSQAMLTCAAAGEADASWHALFAALAADAPGDAAVDRWTTAIMNHGATSGTLMLAGFLACC